MRTYIYVDGYNLYYGRLRGTPYKWLDVVALFSEMVRTVEPGSEVAAHPGLCTKCNHTQTIHLMHLLHLMCYPAQDHEGRAIADKTGERYAYD